MPHWQPLAALAALALAIVPVAACKKSESGTTPTSDDANLGGPVVHAARADANNKLAAPENDAKVPLALQIDFKSKACIKTTRAATCFESIPELIKATPELVSWVHASPQNRDAFAGVVHWLGEIEFRANNPGYVGRSELVRDPKQAEEIITKFLSVPNLAWLTWWRADTRSFRPAGSTALAGPTLEGNTLTAYALARQNKSYDKSYKRGVAALRYQVQLDTGGAIETTRLDSEPYDLSSHRAAVHALFGAPVDAFSGIEATPEERLLIAIGGKRGAAALVVVDQQKNTYSFKSWAQLQKAMPKVAGPKVVAKLADALVTFYKGESSDAHCYVIDDAKEYRRLYAENNWRQLKLRYWHDQLRVTDYTIPEFDTIADPSIKNERLTAYCMERPNSGREPSRLVMNLRSLALSSKYTLTPMSTSKVVAQRVRIVLLACQGIDTEEIA